MKKWMLSLAGALIALPLAARADDPIVLKLPIGSPLTSPVFLNSTKPWIEEIEKEGGGLLKIQVYPPGSLNNAQNVYDRLVNNVYELAYGIHGPITTVFPRTSVAELPFLATESEHASQALWDLVENGTIAKEYAAVRPLGLFIYPQTQLHFTKPVRTMEDMKGIKVGAQSRVMADICNLLGATPITTSPPDVYEMANRHTITGVMMAWTGVQQFKVHEVTNFHVEAFMGSLTGFVMMNTPAYDRLPQKAKDIFDRNSYRALSKRFGVALDGIAKAQRSAVEKMPNHTIITLSPAERARWEKQVQPVYQHWVEGVPDGAKVLAAFRAALQKETPKK
jgi:TRAP-type C4-dicarboxylate transport system substrate-binding protein